MVVVAVQLAGATFTYGKPQALSDLTAYFGAIGRSWDVSADGKEFLMIKNEQAAGLSEGPTLTIVTHWLDEVRARVK